MITLKEAEEYLNFGIKEGNYDEGEFDGWTDEEKIKFAEEQMAKGDAIANANEEEE